MPIFRSPRGPEIVIFTVRGITAGDAGNVYVGMNDTKTVQKYVKK